MSWFKFEVKSGGEQYRWVEDDLGEDDEYELNKLKASCGADSYVKVYEVPPAIRQQMTEEAQARVRADQNLLTQLLHDAIQHPPEGRELETLLAGGSQVTFQAEQADDLAARAWDRAVNFYELTARYKIGVERRSALDLSRLARDRAKRRREHK